MINEEEKSEIASETLQKIFTILADFASEQIGIPDAMNTSEEDIDDACRNLINDSDDLRADIIAHQRAFNLISDIASKIDDSFPDETLTMGFTSLSAQCTTISANQLLAKALIDDFWKKTE